MMHLRFLGLVLLLAACGGDRPTDARDATVRIADPAALLAALSPAAHAVTTAPLQSLGALAWTMHESGIDVHYLSPLHAGGTFVFDPGSARYVRSTIPGAPVTGLRIMLYAIDSATMQPVTPLTEVGFVELIPRNSHFNDGTTLPVDTTKLRYRVMGVGATPRVYADFTAWSVWDPYCLCAHLEGWVDDGVARMEFDFPYRIIPFQLAEFPGTFQTSPRALRIGQETYIGDTTSAAVGSMRFASDSLWYRAEVAQESSGRTTSYLKLEVNGRELATVRYDQRGETFETPPERVLTATEKDVFRELFRTALGIGTNVEFPVLVIFFCGC